MKKILTILATNLVLMAGANAAPAVESYITPQNKLIVAGLQPGKLYGVLATTDRNGVGVRNFTANACGEVIIDRANIFQSITIDRRKLLIEKLAVKEYANCTQVWRPAVKPQ
jgi:hypothetical protein